MQNAIRKEIKNIRDNLNYSVVQNLSKIIENKLLTLDIFKQNLTFFVYKDFKNEVQTDGIIKFLKSLSKTVCHPLIFEDNMLSVKPLSSEFMLDKYGVLTPKHYEIKNDVDVAIIPLIACNTSKNRIGFGKGYYDKFLKDKSILKIGLCYDFQVVENITPNPWDIPLDIIITDKRIIK